MIKKEPKFMKDLHKIREQITRGWKNKTPHQIVSEIRKAAAKADLN